MGFLQRLVVALGLAALAAAGIRIGGGSEVSPMRGGWSPMNLPPDDESADPS